MVVGSIVGALLAFVYNRVVGVALGPVGFEPIGNAWTAMFVLATVVLVPLEQYVLREVSRGRDPVRQDRGIIFGFAIGTALVAGFVAYLGRNVWFQGSTMFAPILAVMLGGFTALGVAKGVTAGRRTFGGVGALLIFEGVIRLVAALVLLAVAREPEIVGWSIAAAPLAALVWLGWFKAPRVVVDVARTPPVPFFSAYILGSGASQVLLAAAPLVVKLLDGTEAAASIVFMTFTLFRAPLTLIFSLQGRLLSVLVRLADQGEFVRLRRAAAGIAMVGALATGMAWWVGGILGPGLVASLFSAEFRPSVELASWTAAGIVAASTAQILGQLLVARAATGRLAMALGLGPAVAVAVAFGAGGLPEHRVALGFGIGEAAAMAAVGFIVLRTYRTPVLVPA